MAGRLLHCPKAHKYRPFSGLVHHGHRKPPLTLVSPIRQGLILVAFSLPRTVLCILCPAPEARPFDRTPSLFALTGCFNRCAIAVRPVRFFVLRRPPRLQLPSRRQLSPLWRQYRSTVESGQFLPPHSPRPLFNSAGCPPPPRPSLPSRLASWVCNRISHISLPCRFLARTTKPSPDEATLFRDSRACAGTVAAHPSTSPSNRHRPISLSTHAHLTLLMVLYN